MRDLVDNVSLQKSCFAALEKFKDKLPGIFRVYSIQGTYANTMSSLAFFGFCHTCKIIDKKVDISAIDRIWNRVNIMESWESVSEVSDGEMVLKVNKKTDPFNPHNQFVRGEFYEALFRLAALKFDTMSVDMAFIKMMNENVLPFALGWQDPIRELLMSDSIQRIMQTFSQRLRKLFINYVPPDRKGKTKTKETGITPVEYELMLHRLGIIDAKHSKRAIAQAFSMSQIEETDEDLSGLNVMIFPEFLECIARLADMREEPPVASLPCYKNAGKKKEGEDEEVKEEDDTDVAPRDEVQLRKQRAVFHLDDDAAAEKSDPVQLLTKKLTRLLGHIFPSDSDMQAMRIKQQQEQEQKEKEAKEKAEAEAKLAADKEAAKAEKSKGKPKKPAGKKG
jgi:hypothetical protein